MLGWTLTCAGQTALTFLARSDSTLSLPVITVHNLDSAIDRYRVVEPDSAGLVLNILADEYMRLRSHCALPMQAVSVNGLSIDASRLEARLRAATIPRRRLDNFDIIRSDLAEMLCYALLEDEYGTRFGYQGVCHRETTQLPGRGIDAVGIEDGDPLTLVLGEAKVSDEKRSPPRVVDTNDDSLRNQHRGHLRELEATASKVWNMSRHVMDMNLRDRFFVAASLLEFARWDKLRVVSACVLVRPKDKYTKADFGSFMQSPSDFRPAYIRYWVVSLPDGVEPTVTSWYESIERAGGLK